MDTRYLSDMRHNQVDIGETIAQRRRRAGTFKINSGPPPERRSTISSMMPSSYQVTRMRNLSGGSNGSTASGSSSGSSSQLDNQYSDNPMFYPLDISYANSSAIQQCRGDSPSSHRKLDRSLSDSDSDRLGNGSSHRSVNSSRYKTELCRPFEESGSCKYGDKCQFAHGIQELRNLARHPKYKTELCRTFHTTGFCPYGPRCHFIHGDDKAEPSAKGVNSREKGKGSPSLSGSSSPSLSPSGSDDHSYFQYRSDTNPRLGGENRPNNNSLTVNINYNNVDIQSLEQQFNSALNFKNNCLNESASNMFNSSNLSDGNKGTTSQEVDIFSRISVFNPQEVLDNDRKPVSLSYNRQSQLDNSPPHVNPSILWQNSYNVFQTMGPLDPFHCSPTGSTGSDSGNISDCTGSTESLASSEQAVNSPDWEILQSFAQSNTCTPSWPEKLRCNVTT